MPENQVIEYKESWRDEYLKWICGFANAQGGRLYIGVDDTGKVIGVTHYRTGSVKKQLTGVALTDFLLKKAGNTWDNTPLYNVKIDDFRHDSFDIFREQALLNNKMDEQALNVSNSQLLDNLNLLQMTVYSRKIGQCRLCLKDIVRDLIIHPLQTHFIEPDISNHGDEEFKR